MKGVVSPKPPPLSGSFPKRPMSPFPGLEEAHVFTKYSRLFMIINEPVPATSEELWVICIFPTGCILLRGEGLLLPSEYTSVNSFVESTQAATDLVP